MKNLIITEKGFVTRYPDKGADSNRNQSVYEVIRLIDGVALFLEDHFNRLLSSVQMSDIEFDMEYVEFERHIKELARINDQQTGNVKFVLSADGKDSNWSFSFIPHSYPSSDEYQHGVATGLLFAERDNPGAKIIQNAIRDKANQQMADKKLYEVLLVDSNGLITEGSRSNVFFVKDNCFFTAPRSMVLAGVTRMKVLECLEELKCTVMEEAVLASQITAFNAVFLTGTSPKVLPVNCIDESLFEVNNPLVGQLMDHYNAMIEKYIAAKTVFKE